MTREWIPALPLALALLAGAGATQEEDPAARRAASANELVDGLEDLAAWAGQKRLGARKDELWATIVYFDPDHERARKELGWRRDRAGAWQQGDHRPGRDRSERHVGELLERRAALVAAYRELLLELVDVSGAHGAVPAELRAMLWEDLIALDPDDARARAERGEDRDVVTGEWLLSETLRARSRRDELERALRSIEDELPEPRRVGIRARDRALSIDWTAAFKSPNVLVVGTVEEEVLADLARRAEATLALYAEAVARELRAPTGFAVYVLAEERDREALLEGHPSFDAGARASARNLASSWIPGSNEIVLWPAERALQTDHLARQTVALMLSRTYHVDFERGWVYEGFGTWMTELQTGDSLAGFSVSQKMLEGTESPAAESEPASLLEEARRAASAHGGPRLADVVAKRGDRLTEDERLLAYALARYLAEGRPEELQRLLGLQGLDRESAQALEDALGTDLGALELRLGRWLAESAR